MERLTPLPWQRELWTRLVQWRPGLPHALLLHGNRGIGKRHLFKAFAQLLLCESPADDKPCGKCAGCLLIAADNHPDLRWLVPAAQMPQRDDADSDDEEAADSSARSTKSKAGRDITIDQVRRASEMLSISSHRGGRHVVLLHPAEALNVPAGNALLKMLEEPPPNSVFLVVSDELDNVLPTIRSRCVLLRSPRPTHDEALAYLRSLDVSDAESRLAEAGGAPVGISEEAVDFHQELDPAAHATLLKLLGKGAQLTGAEIASAVDKDIAVAPAIRLLQRWGWDLLAERLAGRLRYHPRHQRQLATLARTVEPARMAEWIASLAQMQAASDHPLNSRLVIEGALLGYADAMRSKEVAHSNE